jgi:hypothetical protein
MRMWPLFALVAGCAIEHPKLPDTSNVQEPTACGAHASLDGSGVASPTVLGPFALDASGIALCLHLDATANARVHFVASTEYEPGAASSFALTLEDATRNPIVDGWDLSVNDRSFANLEWGPPVGQVTDVVVWLRSHDGVASTTASVWLFDPLE